jgi:hypothetical protein
MCTCHAFDITNSSLLKVHEGRGASGNIFEPLLSFSAGYQAFIECIFLL